jgi:hypothetical protein
MPIMASEKKAFYLARIFEGRNAYEFTSMSPKYRIESAKICFLISVISHCILLVSKSRNKKI